MRRVLVIAIFVFLAMNAFAQSGYDYMYSEPTKKLYMDLSLGGFMPSGSYVDPSPVDLELSGTLCFGIGINYYMNDYLGVDFMMLITGAESEKYSGFYADVSIFYLGGGLAGRYKVSDFMEVYANAGIAIASASYSIEPTSSTATSEGDMTIAAYLNAGVRLFPGTNGVFYILGDMKFIAAGSTTYELTTGGEAEIGLSGVTLSAGVGMAF